MPLLPLEPFVHPADLFTDPAHGDDNSLQWWALHTRPRAEKSLARRLLKREVSFFLPLYHREWKSRGRVQKSHLPLFPGYLFLRGDTQARLISLETNLVARTLPVDDPRQLYFDLSQVYHLIVSGKPLSPEERLQPGDAVEITTGPLTGLVGKVLRRGKQQKIFVEVKFLQQGVSVEMEAWSVKPVS